MNQTNEENTGLDDARVHVKIKLAALWASVMSCYIYGDYFWLYKPGKLAEIFAGKMAPLGQVTQGVLFAVSFSMAVPAVMIFASVAVGATLNRWLNMTVGLFYTLFVLVTMPGAWAFYMLLGVVDILLTSLVVWYAWRWPRIEMRD